MSLILVKVKYYEWLLMQINAKKSYGKLLAYLHQIPFRWSIKMDENREADGLALRYQFAAEHDVLNMDDEMDNADCSVLEMMVALAIQCEVSIGMDDPDFGNRTDQWFWGMIENLGLKTMVNSRFDEQRVAEVIDRFLDREYDPDGTGGLFTIENCKYDLREVELWYQACWYFDQFI